LSNGFGNILEGAARLARQVASAANFLHAYFHGGQCFGRFGLNRLDEMTDITCSASRPFSQLSDLIGDHAEAKARFNCMCRFDSRVQSQQVCLSSDFVNEVDNLG